MTNEVATLFLEHSEKKFAAMADLIDGCLAKLTDEEVWRRGSDAENAIGNLVLHLCGNMRQYIGSAVGGLPDIRVRDAEFSAREGLTREELKAKLRKQIEDSAAVVSGLTPERLTETVMAQGKDWRVLEVVYQVVGHLQQHTGQILYATKNMTAGR